MKLIYLFPNSYVAGSANRIQTLNFAYSLLSISEDNNVLFVSGDNYTDNNLRRLGIEKKDINHVEINYKFKKMLTIQFMIKVFLDKLITSDCIIYVRDYSLLKYIYYLKRFNILKNEIIFELHEVPQDKSIISRLKIVDRFVVISNAIKMDINRKININEKDIVVAHDGFSNIKTCPNKSENVNDLLKIIDDDTIVYIGTYQKWKNIELIIEIATLLQDIKFILIGVERAKINWQYEIPKNVYFINYIDHSDVHTVLEATKFAIYSLNPNHSISKYTSPLKIFEYLSHGITIFSPSFISINEVLVDRFNAYLFDIKDINSTADMIKNVVEKKLYLNLEDLKNSVQNYSWENRAKKVLNFVEDKN